MVDTGDLKSPGHCDRVGSTPTRGTIYVEDSSELLYTGKDSALFRGSNPHFYPYNPD